jgi:hypothetical protein
MEQAAAHTRHGRMPSVKEGPVDQTFLFSELHYVTNEINTDLFPPTVDCHWCAVDTRSDSSAKLFQVATLGFFDLKLKLSAGGTNEMESKPLAQNGSSWVSFGSL